MSAFAHFGDAIHTAFPLITEGINPHKMTLPQIQRYLERSPIGHHLTHAEDAFFERVHVCWKYIYNMIAQADRVLEIDLPSRHYAKNQTNRSKKSDIVFLRRGTYYVIEIKSRPSLKGLKSKQRCHIKWRTKYSASQQIRSNVVQLLAQGIPSEKIRTFIIFIDNERVGRVNIEKVEIPFPFPNNSA